MPSSVPMMSGNGVSSRSRARGRNERTEAGEDRILRLRPNDVRELVRRITRIDCAIRI